MTATAKLCKWQSDKHQQGRKQMFNAKLIDVSGGWPGADYGITKGKTYEVIDFNDYMGTYTIRNDWGNRMSLNWDRFEDQGRASTEYEMAGGTNPQFRFKPSLLVTA